LIDVNDNEHMSCNSTSICNVRPAM